MDSARPDSRILAQYLLGSLPDEETERLDELSVLDDEVSWRLLAAENDLVDSYARGELSGETLERFEERYLSTERRREKVRFAETLRDFEEASAEWAGTRGAGRGTRPRNASWVWSLAAALAAVGIGYLLLANGRLREELVGEQSRRASLETRTSDLQKRLAERPPATAATAIVAAVLAPPTRGAGTAAAVSVPPGTDVVALQLELESDEFQRYRVAVKAADGKTIWESGELSSALSGKGKAVTASVPAALLSPRHYSADLQGVAAGGSVETLGSYPFVIVVR